MERGGLATFHTLSNGLSKRLSNRLLNVLSNKCRDGEGWPLSIHSLRDSLREFLRVSLRDSLRDSRLSKRDSLRDSLRDSPKDSLMYFLISVGMERACHSPYTL